MGLLLGKAIAVVAGVARVLAVSDLFAGLQVQAGVVYGLDREPGVLAQLKAREKAIWVLGEECQHGVSAGSWPDNAWRAWIETGLVYGLREAHL
jgi:hypothetical protein